MKNTVLYDAKIVYFAGADSTKDSRLVRALQAKFDTDTLLCFYGFQDENPKQFIIRAKDEIKTFVADEKEVFFIGQSYGGYYANYFAEGCLNNMSHPAFLINRMVFPEKSTRFNKLELATSTDPSPLYKAIYLSEKDELVPIQPTQDFFRKSQAVRHIFLLENETHRIKDLNPILNSFMHYYNNMQEG